jgi:hypothetical protein
MQVFLRASEKTAAVIFVNVLRKVQQSGFEYTKCQKAGQYPGDNHPLEDVEDPLFRAACMSVTSDGATQSVTWVSTGICTNFSLPWEITW